jgi:type IV pilus assembly protein PilY1
MRRGGRLLYALDVSNPRQPKFLWKKTGDSLSILGQTWSEPRVAKVKGYSNPVIVMGAGYDNAAEDVSPPATNTSMGNAVLVLDAFDGSVLRTFSTTRSVAADISLIDSDYDGLVDRGYAVDVAGNVYRIDFENGTKTGTSDWGMYKLAALGTTATRKFFYPPDAVVTRSFTALMLATGDREKPLATTSADRFFTLYDTRTTKGTPDTAPTPVKDTDLGLVGSGAAMDKGCYIALDTAGEKAVNAPVTAAGITYFSTNKPIAESTNSCKSNLGEARVYSAPLFCQAATSQKLIGGGLPPSPVLGVVTVSYTSQSTNQTVSKDVPFIIGAPNAKASGIEGSKVKPTITPTRKRKYWYLENAR